MEAFQNIIGHEDIKRYFRKAVASGHVAHSYIFEGIEGVGKKTMAKEVAQMLMCENEDADGDKSCGKCKACQLIESGNHPDINYIDKDTKVTKIDTIRERVVQDMEIKPFGKYKIIIINEADTVTVEGQNAMLKTIEEPPSYGIVILITKNLSKLLPTIESRCIHIRFNPLGNAQMIQYLERKGLPLEKQVVYAQFSEGSIGIANKLLEDEVFLEKRRESIEYLQNLEKADLMKVYDYVKTICEEKEQIDDILTFWELWYRDLALLKSTDTDKLYYLDYKYGLLDMASKLTYNKIGTHIDLIRQAKIQINQNIYPTFVIENLLLKLKERKR
ncbi:MAG: ATP-binding protein [Cellulosilyticaceae bacterium]